MGGSISNEVPLFIGDSVKGNRIFFSEDEYKHIRAKRLSAEDEVQFMVSDSVYLCKIDSLKERKALLIKKVRDIVSLKKICIACAFPKGKRKSFLVEKLAEIGVDTLIPLTCTRAVYTPDEASLARLKKIGISALKQSHGIPMNITASMTIDDIVGFSSALNTKLVLVPNAVSRLSDMLKSPLKSGTICVIGPEGGLKHEEISILESNGFTKVKLNTNILRIETCAIYTAAIIKEYITG